MLEGKMVTHEVPLGLVAKWLVSCSINRIYFYPRPEALGT